MRRRPQGARWFRWAGSPTGGAGDDPVGPEPSASLSTLTLDDYDIPADGVTEATAVSTLVNASSVALEGVTASDVLVERFVSVANSFVTSTPAEIANDGVERGYFTLFLRDTNDDPIRDVAAADCVLAVSGTGNTVTQPTGRTAADGSITGSFVSTGAASKTGSYTVFGTAITDTASVTVTGGAPSGITFESKWDAGTITDGGEFDGVTCPNTSPVVGEIVTGASVGFRSDNVYKLNFRGSECCMVQRSNAVPESTTHYARVFFRNDEYGNKNDHPLAYHNIHGSDAIQAVPFQRIANSTSAGRWQVAGTTDGSYPYNRFYSPELDNGVWYRIEWKMEYVTATTFKWQIRIYDYDNGDPEAAGTLLYDNDDLLIEGGGQSFTTWMASNSVTLAGGAGADAALARNFGLGNEGPSGASDTNQPFYYAELAFSTADWIGAAIV